MPTLGKTKVSPSLISTGSTFQGTSSYAITASYAMNGGSGGSGGAVQTGHDPLIYDPAVSTTTFRRVSEKSGYAGSVPSANIAISAFGRLWVANTSSDKVTVTFSDLIAGHVWGGGTSGSLDVSRVWPNGADAASLELRMLAHYMKDEEYAKEIVEGDIHTKKQIAAGLQTRAQAKSKPRFTLSSERPPPSSLSQRARLYRPQIRHTRLQAHFWERIHPLWARLVNWL